MRPVTDGGTDDGAGRTLADGATDLPESARESRTAWTCLSCGLIGGAQSCAGCGGEAMPGEWVRAESVSALVSPAIKRFRADGWPYCPRCDEDELYSLANPATVETIVGCYRCDWKPGVSPTVEEPGRERFTIRWDRSMGCYRVSVPNLGADGERVEVVLAEDYDRLRAEVERLREALTHIRDLPISEAAPNYAAEVLAGSPSGKGTPE